MQWNLVYEHILSTCRAQAISLAYGFRFVVFDAKRLKQNRQNKNIVLNNEFTPTLSYLHCSFYDV